MHSHVVKTGENLWAIAKQYNLQLQDVLTANPAIDHEKLEVGQKVAIPISSLDSRSIEVNAYIDPMVLQDCVTPVKDIGKLLTYLSVFSYSVTPQGQIVGMEDEIIIDAAKAKGVSPVLVLTNFDGNSFSPDLAYLVMVAPEIRYRLICNLITTMKIKGYRVLNMDFELIKPEHRQLYNDFLKELGKKVREAGFLFSTALAPKTSDSGRGDWQDAHDYRAHGEVADYTIIMSYEWGWSGGPPYAIAPINKVREVLDYAVTHIPRKKILMGATLYGYDWALPYVPGGQRARAISPQNAIELAAANCIPIKYDEKLEAPYFNYCDRTGQEHVVWFEDARSVKAKLNLISEYGLRGVSYWVLGYEFPQNWAFLESKFQVKKH